MRNENSHRVGPKTSMTARVALVAAIAALTASLAPPAHAARAKAAADTSSIEGLIGPPSTRFT